MAKKINQERCIQCGACITVCPNDGISEEAGAVAIDSGLCTECYGFHAESTCASVCPVDAIDTDPGRCETLETLQERAASLRPDAFPRD